MKRLNRFVMTVVVATAAAHASCGTNDPTRVGRPPVVESFQPSERVLDAYVGDTLRFTLTVSDPDRDPLSACFDVDNQKIADGFHWDFVVLDTGMTNIRGRVSDGAHSSYIDWRVRSSQPINATPIIVSAFPVETNPVLVVNHELSFGVVAQDPEEAALDYTFSVNDSIVARNRQFTYQPASLGMKRVRVVVSDGMNSVVRGWDLKVTTVPDNVPPGPVVMTLAETGVAPGEINIEWTAVGRDGMVGKPSLYQVRTSPVPFITELDWTRGSDRPGVPAPVTAGETMSMVVGGLLPARAIYVAVRAVDDFGNISPLQAPTQVVTRGMRFGGRVIDTVSWDGIPNAIVTFGNDTHVTDANGEFEFTEQGYGDGVIIARDETGAEVGAYYDYDRPYSVQHLDVVNMHLLPNRPLTTTYYTDFLQFFRNMTDVGYSPFYADQRRRELPVPLYVRPYVRNGLDYAATIRSVAEEFDALIGVPAFVNVTEPLPDIRVETTYNGVISRDRYTVLDWSQDWYPLSGLIEFRIHYTPDVVEAFKQIIRHEFGHAFGLNHSTDPKHLMVGGQAASVPTLTDDERAVLRSYYSIPRGTNVRRFQRN